MIRLDAQARAELRDLKRRERAIVGPAKDAAKKARKADQRAREKRSGKARRSLDDNYIGWLHEGLPCIACMLLGPSAGGARIEAAHQKVNAPSRGIQKRAGVRPSDWLCVPLCEGHHRTGTPCCDPAQAKFWALVGLLPEQVVDFCAALYGAFEQEADGAVIVRDFASLAAGQRMEAAT